MPTSEEKYFIAKKLYKKIKKNFFDIENNGKSELIDETIDAVEEAIELENGINLRVLKKLYPDDIYGIRKNVEKLKDQAEYVLISLKKMKDYVPKVEQRHHLPPEMYPDKERKEWEEQMRKRKEGGTRDKTIEFDMGEGFVSFKDYKNYKQI